MPNVAGQLLLQLILILLNAFFAATEIAVISLNDKKLKARAEEGDRKAARMLKMVEEPTQFLSTIQIGITLAGFLGSAFAADNFAQRLSDAAVRIFRLSEAHAGTVNTVSVVVITLILSYFTLVFGELVPKRVAMKHKEKLAEAVTGPIQGLSAVLKPVIWLLTVSTNGVLRLFGIDPHDKEEPVSEEDIVVMLDAGADEGTLDESNIRYIKNVFKLDGMTAEEVMTPRSAMVMLPSDASDAEILKVIEDESYSRIPVYDGGTDHVIGILQAGEYLLKHDREGFRLEDAMSHPVFVPAAAHLDVLFKEMQKEHNHLTVVINEFGETAGVVTMEDILEEIVGEIWDERDEAVEEIVPMGENTYRVRCSANIEAFFSFFDMEADRETEAATVNGWITEKTGSIPEKGTSFRYGNLKITVTEADEYMAKEASVTVLGPKKDGPV